MAHRPRMLDRILTILAFLAIVAVLFVPVLSVLAATPLHDGAEVPGPVLVYAAALATVVIAAPVVWGARRLLQRRHLARRKSGGT